MRHEAQLIADAIQKVLSAAIIDYEANVGCDGIPVRDYGFITDAAWDEEGDAVELTIQPGNRIWEIRPQELGEVPSRISKQDLTDGGLFWSHPKG